MNEQMNKDNNLEQTINNLKIGKGVSQHDYLIKYDFYFNKLKDKNLNILEIGVANGASLNLWKNYFTSSNIYGIDINKDAIHNQLGKGCKIFIGDQKDKKFLTKVCDKIPDGLDIIIDDGSHITSDVVNTFKYLFKKLNSGGIYIIEDLQTSYNKKYRKGEYKSTINFLKKMIDKVNHDGKFRCNNFDRIIKKSVKLNKYEKIIESIHFYSGICFIFKR